MLFNLKKLLRRPRKVISDENAQQIIDQVRLSTCDEIASRLAELEQIEYLNVYQSAMCYSPMPMSNHYDFLCPRDGHRTVHYADEGINYYLMSIESGHKLIEELNRKLKADGSEISFELDDRPLCAICSGGHTENVAYLIVRYGDGTEHREVIQDINDLRALEALFEGKRYLDTQNMGEYVEHLRKLLGIKGDENA